MATTPVSRSHAVDAALHARVLAIRNSTRPDVILRDEAQEVIDELRETDPQSLIDWFEEHMRTILGQQLRLRLAEARRSSRQSAFSTGNIEEDQLHHPFGRRYAVSGNVWKRAGDMLKGDWQYVRTRHANQAAASLFEVKLADMVLERLPDDMTPTSAVMTPEQLAEMETSARFQAEEAIQ